MTTEDLIVSRLNLNHQRYCLFTGAGISVCSGLPLATVDLPDLPSIVTNIKRDFYNSLGNPPLDDTDLYLWYKDQKLLQQPDSIYSDALNLIGDTPRSRQNYLRRFFERTTPGCCHNDIAKLVELEHIDIIFTTNFDSLIEDAIRNNGSIMAPKVAAHTVTINDILLTEQGPKVIKLHGDYLFSDIKNTEEETEELTDNMRSKLRNILIERGLIVIGYSGSDNSVMSIIEQMIFDGNFFPYGLYWLFLEGHEPNSRVKTLIERADAKLLPIVNSEGFLTTISGRLGE